MLRIFKKIQGCLKTILSLALLLALPACGYHVAGGKTSLPPGIKTLGIPTLVNKTTLQEVEQLLTRALIEQVSERTTFRITSKEVGSDAVLHGEILSFTAAPVLFGAETFATAFLVTIHVTVRLTQDGGRRVLFENPNYIFRDQYVINSDVKQFFSEKNPALQRIARDFAASVVTTFLTGM